MNQERTRYPARPALPAPTASKLADTFQLGDEGKDELMQLAKEYANLLHRKVKTNQLRNLLDIIIWTKSSHKGTKYEDIKAVSKGRLAVCRPRLAYMAAREKGLRDLQKALNCLLEQPEMFKQGEDLDRLYEFVSVVVAYHKYAEATSN
ncbi:MAG: type III-A CRISPR-associated protein Csm2 [Candidatus Obscuribacterales bacterium]|nr:type III-A CRISPR-associated protein Csm2 [Candidatus Obscuribacterales bacterium]